MRFLPWRSEMESSQVEMEMRPRSSVEVMSSELDLRRDSIWVAASVKFFRSRRSWMVSREVVERKDSAGGSKRGLDRKSRWASAKLVANRSAIKIKAIRTISPIIVPGLFTNL